MPSSKLKYPPLILLPLIAGALWAARAADPSALWKIDSEKCVPHMRDAQDPAPCAIVDLSAGYVVLKDITGATQFLLMPTARISGIESPAVLAPDATNYWDRAWRARTLAEARAGKNLPRDTLSLAVNSPYGRSQDQLHIHIDCVRPDVRDALIAHRDAVGESWDTFPVQLVGESWRAMRVNGDNLGTVNPFRLLAYGEPDAAANMGKYTLVVVGMTWPGQGMASGGTAPGGTAPGGTAHGVDGFVVLDGKVDPATGNRGAGEDLQDHACALAH